MELLQSCTKPSICEMSARVLRIALEKGTLFYSIDLCHLSTIMKRCLIKKCEESVLIAVMVSLQSWMQLAESLRIVISFRVPSGSLHWGLFKVSSLLPVDRGSLLYVLSYFGIHFMSCKALREISNKLNGLAFPILIIRWLHGCLIWYNRNTSFWHDHFTLKLGPEPQCQRSKPEEYR